MIRKQDILDRAGEWQLRAEIVEKDYVLGWLLAAIAEHPETSAHWVFKGGTCLRKCYVETYRFSEDLDFTLVPDAAYAEQELRRILGELARRATDLSGIDFPVDQVAIKGQHDKQSRRTFKGKIAYRGPLAVPTWPRVLIDLTQHEPLLDGHVMRQILHTYSDNLPPDARVRTYSLEELLAEKARALLERARPRDLYDVVYLLENLPEALDLDRARRLFQGKCQAKGFAPPAAASLMARVQEDPEIAADWANMLAHQLPQLPSIHSLLARLPGLLTWVEATVRLPTAALVAAPARPGEELVAPAGVRLWGSGVPIESVRFAGANRLLVEFTYDGKRRLVEPYSLRRAQTGNLILYGWEKGAANIKAFNMAQVQGLVTTDTPFSPRYRIEFTPTAPVTLPPPAASTRRRP
jgi:predicted nucleotidyltransferase component of viral defense system